MTARELLGLLAFCALAPIAVLALVLPRDTRHALSSIVADPSVAAAGPLPGAALDGTPIERASVRIGRSSLVKRPRREPMTRPIDTIDPWTGEPAESAVEEDRGTLHKRVVVRPPRPIDTADPWAPAAPEPVEGWFAEREHDVPVVAHN